MTSKSSTTEAVSTYWSSEGISRVTICNSRGASKEVYSWFAVLVVVGVTESTVLPSFKWLLDRVSDYSTSSVSASSASG